MVYVKAKVVYLMINPTDIVIVDILLIFSTNVFSIS